MRAFVTGSTGLLGNNLVRALLAEGWSVRALVRSEKKGKEQLGELPGVELVVGDLDGIAALGAHLKGVDVIFHTAAYFREYSGDADDERRLRALNVDATVALARLGLAHGVKRFVHTSSSGTIAMRADGKSSTEADVRDASKEPNRYFASKVLADEALAALRAETGLDLVTILPGWMFGPGDAGPTAAGQLVLDAIDDKLPPAALPGDITVADARDVAAAMIRAATVATPGERFIVAGRHHTLPDILAQVARAAGRTPPRFTLPYPAAWGFAVFSEASAAVRGVEPLVTRMHLRTLNGGDNLSSQHAIDRLGVTFRPLDQTLLDTVAWFQANMRRTNAGGSSTSAASREARASA